MARDCADADADAWTVKRRLHARLLARIHRRWRTRREVLQIGQLRVDFTRIAQPDVVLDEVAALETQRSQESKLNPDAPRPALTVPYWAELWESSIALSEVLEREGPVAAGARRAALDLGCGMGLCGTVAAALGWQVMLADLEPAALLLAAVNSGLWQERVRVRRVDWQRDRLGERFDRILGADILYERGQWAFLEPFMRLHLAAGGDVLLGEPGRQTGSEFVPWISQQGWTVSVSNQAVGGKTIRVIRLTRPEALRQKNV